MRHHWLVAVAALAAFTGIVSLRAQDKPALTTSGPDVPKGIEVLARGPVHEAFATPTTEPAPTRPIPRQPPKPLDEMPPDEKPEGDVTWIGGYWAWDDERQDFLWVSGTWRTSPPQRQWVPGYWREGEGGWQWVPGFWAARDETKPDAAVATVNYLPAPPATPATAPPGDPPAEDAFYVPGNWVYGDTTYAWRAGYWARVQPGYVWVPAHYRWTPAGYVFIPGYWDLAVSRRGVLYAPVVVDPAVRVSYVYTPSYAVRDTVVLDTLFVRPSYCHYYFGDYYGPVYRDLGYESCILYSRRRYDAIIVYQRWERRREPGWEAAHLNVVYARHAGRAPLPPRTLFVQANVSAGNRNVVRNPALAPAGEIARANGRRTVALDPAARQQVRQQTVAVQQATQQRTQKEMLRAGVQSRPVQGPAAARPPAATPAAAIVPRPASPPARTVPPAAAAPTPALAPAKSQPPARPPVAKQPPPRPQPPPARRPPPDPKQKPDHP